jgi:hypothetical protein
MAGTTTDPNDPDLTRGADSEPVPQAKKYLVMPGQGDFVRPVRRSYIHQVPGCGALTTMSLVIAETYARNPDFYGSTYCVGCKMHRPVGADGEFVWDGSDERVGT